MLYVPFLRTTLRGSKHILTIKKIVVKYITSRYVIYITYTGETRLRTPYGMLTYKYMDVSLTKHIGT